MNFNKVIRKKKASHAHKITVKQIPPLLKTQEQHQVLAEYMTQITLLSF